MRQSTDNERLLHKQQKSPHSVKKKMKTKNGSSRVLLSCMGCGCCYGCGCGCGCGCDCGCGSSKLTGSDIVGEGGDIGLALSLTEDNALRVYCSAVIGRYPPGDCMGGACAHHPRPRSASVVRWSWRTRRHGTRAGQGKGYAVLDRCHWENVTNVDF